MATVGPLFATASLASASHHSIPSQSQQPPPSATAPAASSTLPPVSFPRAKVDAVTQTDAPLPFTAFLDRALDRIEATVPLNLSSITFHIRRHQLSRVEQIEAWLSKNFIFRLGLLRLGIKPQYVFSILCLVFMYGCRKLFIKQRYLATNIWAVGYPAYWSIRTINVDPNTPPKGLRLELPTRIGRGRRKNGGGGGRRRRSSRSYSRRRSLSNRRRQYPSHGGNNGGQGYSSGYSTTNTEDDRRRRRYSHHQSRSSSVSDSYDSDEYSEDREYDDDEDEDDLTYEERTRLRLRRRWITFAQSRKEKATRQWLAYWTIYGTVQVLDTWSKLWRDWIPGFNTGKLLFLWWAQRRGATLIFDYFRPLIMSKSKDGHEVARMSHSTSSQGLGAEYRAGAVGGQHLRQGSSGYLHNGSGAGGSMSGGGGVGVGQPGGGQAGDRNSRSLPSMFTQQHQHQMQYYQQQQPQYQQQMYEQQFYSSKNQRRRDTAGYLQQQQQLHQQQQLQQSRGGYDDDDDDDSDSEDYDDGHYHHQHHHQQHQQQQQQQQHQRQQNRHSQQILRDDTSRHQLVSSPHDSGAFETGVWSGGPSSGGLLARTTSPLSLSHPVLRSPPSIMSLDSGFQQQPSQQSSSKLHVNTSSSLSTAAVATAAALAGPSSSTGGGGTASTSPPQYQQPAQLLGGKAGEPLHPYAVASTMHWNTTTPSSGSTQPNAP